MTITVSCLSPYLQSRHQTHPLYLSLSTSQSLSTLLLITSNIDQGICDMFCDFNIEVAICRSCSTLEQLLVSVLLAWGWI